MDKETICRKIMTYGKGGRKASPQRIHIRWLVRFLQEYTKEKMISVLDIGCDSGDYSNIFTETAKGSEYLGIDLIYNNNWALLKDAKKPIINFIAMDIKEINTLPKKYNIIVSFTALEHFENIQEVIRNTY